ncbi:MAG: RNA-binding S4 domain-containing protein [Vicinamibacteria bacterium]
MCLRVDNFLKQSRLVKRRTMAKELCEDGAVMVNGKLVRASKEIAPGDRVTMKLWNRSLEIEVERLPERPPSAADARLLYRIVSDEMLGEQSARPQARSRRKSSRSHQLPEAPERGAREH